MRPTSALLGLAALLAPGVVDAGGPTTGGACNCAPAPKPCCGGAAPTHEVTVPGVTVIPPSVYIAPPRLAGGVEGPGGSSDGGAAGDVSSSVQAGVSSSLLASASTAAAASGYGSSLAAANAQAANLLAASSGGGGGGYGFSEGVSGGSLPNLTVATPGAAPRQVCARTAAFMQEVAVQAVCLDDRDVPHPASQVTPGRDVPEGYSGELFRCVAGAHMQYVLAPWAGAPRFDRGQTVVCAKGEALWRDAGGRLQCRPQAPARDCNERSLLRRYGAGIKVLRAAVAAQCVEWRTEAAAAVEAAPQAAMQLDGGVG